MNSPKPVAFEIPINDISSSPKNVKAIKLRLEQSRGESAAPTLEQLEMKLKKAEEIRKEQFAKQHPITLNKGQQLSRAQQRRELRDKENIAKNSKVLTKLETAEQQRAQITNSNIEKAKKQTEKVEKAQKYREVKQSQFSVKTKEILSKHDQGFQKSKIEHDKVLEKAKTRVAKVQETVEQVKLRKAQDLLNKKAVIEDKILKATVKREQVLDKKKETATLLYQKRSPSKDQKPAENDPCKDLEEKN